MTTTLSPVPKLQFFTNDGKPANGYKLFTYIAGTSTKLATYTDSTGGTPNSNPIVLDFRGEARVWLPPNTPYKFVFAPGTDTDPPGSPIWTVDQVQNAQLLTLYGGVDTGTSNTYLLNFDANFSGYEDGIVVYFVPANTNTGPSVVGINGLGAVPIVTQTGVAVSAGQIVQNQVVSMIYLGGSFRLLTGTTFSGFFTGTLTGMTATVTGTFSYRVSNGIVTLNQQSGGNITGTSNATTMTLTDLPDVISSPQNQVYAVCDKLIDNSVECYGSAVVAGSTVSFRVATVSGSKVVDGAFTNSGTKGIAEEWGLIYQL